MKKLNQKNKDMITEETINKFIEYLKSNKNIAKTKILILIFILILLII